MWPTFGPIKAYTVCYLTAFLVHYLVSWRIARRHRLGWRVWVTVSVLFSVGSIFGGKVLYDLHHSQFDWGALFSPAHYARGGYWGGLLAYVVLAVPAAWWLGKKQRAALDLVALTVPIPFCLAKLGCFLGGCCHGRSCSLPWAVVFPERSHAAPAGVPVHPTQIYEMLVMALALLVFARLDPRRWNGTLLLWLVAIYGFGRALSDAFRGDVAQNLHWGPVSLTQLICVGTAGCSVAWLAWWKHHCLRIMEQAPGTGSGP